MPTLANDSVVFHIISGADESMPNEGEIEKRFENLLVGSDNYIMPQNIY